jgi:hypothetical protein
MMNSSNFNDDMRHVPVRIDYSKARQKYAKGGLAKKAEDVRSAGRMGDDMVVHVNRREFDEMCKRWGKPTVNPHTNMPEFFLGDIFSGIGNLVTSGSSYLPVVGESVSGWLGENPWAAQALGSGLLGAGAGYLTGGNSKSTLLGGALGALAPSLLGGAGIFGGMGAGDPTRGIGDDNSLPKSLTGAADKGASGFAGLPKDKQMIARIAGALTLASLYGGARNSGKPNAAQRAAQQAQQQAQAQFNKPLPQVDFMRAIRGYSGDPRRYGFGGADGMGSWFTNNFAPIPQQRTQQQFAEGGSPRLVEGPGGARDDEIPAMLSHGEYVIDAETLALLGDGSNEAGAKKLDDMREAIRAHKGKALARGKISPNAKGALSYIERGA